MNQRQCVSVPAMQVGAILATLATLRFSMFPFFRKLDDCMTATIALVAAVVLIFTSGNLHAQTATAMVATTTRLSAPAATLAFGQNVTLEASVKAMGGVSTSTSVVSGSVIFKDGTTVLGSSALDAAGVARLTTNLLAGLRTITASYVATSSYQSSTSTPLALPVLGPEGSLPTAPEGSAVEVSYSYDASGNLKSITNAPNNFNLAQSTVFEYDKFNRPVIVTAPSQSITQMEYGYSHKPLVVRDPRGLFTYYAGDVPDRTNSIQSPDSGTSSYHYDGAGNLTERTDARGVVSTYTYDALNRLTQARHMPALNSMAVRNSTSAPVTRTWVYDQTAASTEGFSTNGIGRITTQTYPAGQTQYAYDLRGRLVARRQTLQPIAGNDGAQPTALTSTVRYTYNSAGKVTHLNYPSGRVLNLAYNNGLPSALSISIPSGPNSPAIPVLSQLSYTPDGQVQRWLWHLRKPNGEAITQSHERSYDRQGRLTRLPLGNLVRDIRYDVAGRVSQFNHYLISANTASVARHAAQDHAYTYDLADRIVQARISNAAPSATTTYSYQWDANGNRTSQTIVSSPPTALTPVAIKRKHSIATNSNQLQTLTNPATALAYDQAGLLISDSTGYTLEYDASDSFSSLGTVRTPSGQRFSYHYDNAALRVRKLSVGGAASTTRIFVYDVGAQGEGVTGSYPRLLGEYDGNGEVLREYLWLGDMPVALLSGPANTTKIYPIHADHLNTPRVVLDEQGRMRWVWDGEPFGASAPQENPQGLGTLEMPLRFSGQYADTETGLFVNHFRYYSSVLGRYIQSDPIGLEGGINTFAYVEGNPVSYIDPTGEFLFVPILWGAGVGAVTDIALQLALNGAKFECIKWGQVGASAGLGAIGGGVGGYLAKLREVRQAYQSGLAAAREAELTANQAWAARRALGQGLKQATPPGARQSIYGRNLRQYGDELGPAWNPQKMSDATKTLTDTNPWADSLLRLPGRGLPTVGGAAAGAAAAAGGDCTCQSQ